MSSSTRSIVHGLRAVAVPGAALFLTYLVFFIAAG